MRYTGNQLHWLVTRRWRDLKMAAMLGPLPMPLWCAYLTIVLDVHPPLHEPEARAILSEYSRRVERGAHTTHQPHPAC